ncbi:Beta-galactosidase 3 [Ananas comosus]|uniref:beta-galactosidase n=1 Tax=Ananas comosus TaxID=4615 RepID=A0A199UT62_ANACO|nr:Beta-galactosidase 3 [Ananas comosus]
MELCYNIISILAIHFTVINLPKFSKQAKIWTRIGLDGFKLWGQQSASAPEDVAFAVARFRERWSVQNYYVYHGGTNFGRTTGGPFITTSYDYDAQLMNMADVYTDPSGGCVAFLANIDEEKDKLVVFQNKSYNIPAWSVSILPDCKNVVFNTAKVRSQTSVVDMIPENLIISGSWQIFMEKTGVWGEPDFTKNGFVDHINTTKDSTDYLWYTTSFFVDESEKFLSDGSHPTLKVESKGHAVHAFLNKKLQDFSCFLLFFKNAGPFYEWVGAGLTSVKINGLKNGTMDLSSNKWIYKVNWQIGLEGEYHRIFNPDSRDDIKWMPSPKLPKDQPLIWYKVNVETPKGNDPIGLDMQYMGKGQAWLNGKAVGRYWPRKSSLHDQCTASCNYRGKFSPDKCRTGCGGPTQRWYHVPRSWFQPSGNTLVIFEEKGGDPTKITFARRRMTGVCGYISEDYPSKDLESWDKSKTESDSAMAKVSLNCTDGTVISLITFASFGNPTGACRSYQQGSCHYPHSLSVVEKACLHASSCTVSLSEDHFGRDLCPGITKTLAIEANCS